MPELIYLACPYSSDSKEVMAARYEAVTLVAARLIVHTGCDVFSPITHSHEIVKHVDAVAFPDSLKPSYDYWLRFDFRILDISDWLYVLKLKGWRESIGVAAEIERFTKRLGRARVKYCPER